MRRDCQRCIARFCRAMHLLIVQPYAKPLRAQQQSSTAMRPSMPSSRASRAATSAPSAETVARLAARDRLRLPAVCRRTALSLHVLPCKRPARRRQSRSPTPSSCVSSVSGGSLEIRRSQLRKSLSGSRHSRQQQCPAASKKQMLSLTPSLSTCRHAAAVTACCQPSNALPNAADTGKARSPRPPTAAVAAMLRGWQVTETIKARCARWAWPLPAHSLAN